MNERIKEMLPNPFAVDYQYEHGPLDLYTEKEMLKFAELIVRECAGLFPAEYDTVEGKITIGKIIKQHFGVES